MQNVRKNRLIAQIMFHAKCKEKSSYCPDHGVYRVLFVNFDRMLPPIDGLTKATSK